MAQLKDTIISGSLRVTDSLFTNNLALLSATASTALVTDANKNIVSRAIYNQTVAGHLGWTAATTDIQLITKNTLAYWNGRYDSNNSNLAYCNKGAFGNAVTYGVDDATANGALSTGTGLTTERSVYYGLVTVNNASQTRATGIYAPTSAGTANQILVSSGGNAAPTWKATAAGAAYTSSANGELTFGTLGAGYGGTGQSTYTIGDILYCGTANTLSKLGGNTTTTRKFLRSVATTSGTAVAPAWDTVTKTDVGLGNVTNDAQVKASLGTAKGDMLYWSASATPARLAIGTAGYFLKATADGPVWANTTDITALGTITTGTWQSSTKINASYLSSSNKNRLVWTNGTDGTFTAANHYVNATKIGINYTSEPDYNLYVNGTAGINGMLKITSSEGLSINAAAQLTYIKFAHGGTTPIGEIYHDAGSSGNISKSRINFKEYSYNSSSNSPSTTPLTTYEVYRLPECDKDRTGTGDYTILTTKEYLFPIASQIWGTQTSFSSFTTPGVYSILDNSNPKKITDYPHSNTNYAYGILVVLGTKTSTNTAGNILQLYFSGIDAPANYKLYIRSRYNSSWKGWKQITLT